MKLFLFFLVFSLAPGVTLAAGGTSENEDSASAQVVDNGENPAEEPRLSQFIGTQSLGSDAQLDGGPTVALADLEPASGRGGLFSRLNFSGQHLASNSYHFMKTLLQKSFQFVTHPTVLFVTSVGANSCAVYISLQTMWQIYNLQEETHSADTTTIDPEKIKMFMKYLLVSYGPLLYQPIGSVSFIKQGLTMRSVRDVIDLSIQPMLTGTLAMIMFKGAPEIMPGLNLSAPSGLRLAVQWKDILTSMQRLCFIRSVEFPVVLALQGQLFFKIASLQQQERHRD